MNQLEISLNPHGFFVQFSTSINYDHSLLLDFSVSNETNFLPYFHMYLRHLANDWCGFISVVEQEEDRLLSETVKPLSSDGDDADDICDVRMNGGNVDSVGDSGVVVGDCDDKHGNNGGSSKNDGGDGNMRDVDDGDMEDVGSVGGDNIGIDDDGDINDHGNGNVSGVGGNSVGDDDGEDNDMGDVCSKGGVNTGVNHGDGGDNVGDDSDSGSSDGNSNMGVDVGTDGDGGNSVGVDDSDDGLMGDNCDGGVIDGNSSDGGSFSHDVGHGADGDDDDINGGNDSDSVGGASDDEVVMCNISTYQKTLTCLIRLRYAIERMSSIPYPVTPLVKLMEYIETLYEGQQ